MVYAGFWRRLVAAIIDSLILGACGCIAGGVFGGVMGGVMGVSGVRPEAIQGVAAFGGWVIGIVLNWLYFTLMEASSFQATLGKMAIGIKVTDLQGDRISYGRANARYWSKFLSTMIFLIGYIMAGFTEKKQALHDIIASCLVVLKG